MGLDGVGEIGSRVVLDICVDSSQSFLFDAKGQSVGTELPLGPRLRESGTVIRVSDDPGGWLLSELIPATPYQSC